LDQVWSKEQIAFLLDSCIFIYKPLDMKIVLIAAVVAIIATVVLMKKGKIKDADGNNIPDVLEDAAEEVKEVVKKAKKATTKKKTTK
jgi:hypothetical protein